MIVLKQKQMKTLLFLAVFISGFAVAQTNVIAAKNHSSSQSISKFDTDNFGLPSEKRVVKRVEYLRGDCLVETIEYTMYETRTEIDTICDHPFLKKGNVDLNRIKEMYSSDVEFIGFEKLNSDENKNKRRLKKKKNKKEKSSGLIILLIGGTFFLAYLFVPKLSLSR